ncbi:PhoH family protein [bacterium SCSIO 12643]|nr:PhoH family protein [bacterium SCSIO 12643]
MQETVISFYSKNPVELFGINNVNIATISKHFPRLKITAQGTDIIARGEKSELENFTIRMNFLIEFFNNHNRLTPANIESLLTEKVEAVIKAKIGKEDVLVYGTGGVLIKAKTKNQQDLVRSIDKTDMVFAVGPAGTGKSYTAVALAVRALKAKEVRRIILTRPAVEAGEKLGFLPGDLKEKLDPYLMPLYDALFDMIPGEKLEDYIDKGTVQIAPLAFMRGRTLDNAFVILDEAQNATVSQMKMFLTRMGASAKFIITGDKSQVDLPKNQKSGLIHAMQVLDGVEGISFVKFDESDVIRHRLVKKIIKAYKQEE